MIGEARRACLPFYFSVSSMKPIAFPLIIAAATCVLAACSPAQPSAPTTDDVRVARQDWFNKRQDGVEYVVTSVKLTKCDTSGEKANCTGHETWDTVRNGVHASKDGDFAVPLEKRDKGWVETD